MSGFLEIWEEHLEDIPEVSRFLEAGIGTSYPILSSSKEGLLIRHFHHTAELLGPDELQYGMPRILVTLRYEDFKLVDLVIEPNLGVPPFQDTTYKVTAENAKPEDFDELYDELLKNYPKPPDKALAERYIAGLRKSAPPLLWPFYEVLLKDFQAWVTG